MQDTKRTKAELIEELQTLRARVAKLEGGQPEHRRAEDPVQTSEPLLAGILDDLLTFVALLDARGRVILVNDTTMKRSGLRRQQILGVQFWDAPWWSYAEEARRKIREYVERCAGGEVLTDEIQAQMGDGLVWVEFSMHPVCDENGKVEYLVPEGRDITGRKRAEQALRESEERLRQIANTMEDACWILDWDDQQILFSSPAYEKIWGRSVDDLYRNAEDWAEDIHPDDRARARRIFRKQGAEGRYDEEFRIVRPDGSMRWIRSRGFPVHDESGRVYRVAGISQDITERKLAEEKLRENERFLQSVFDSIQDGISILDGDLSIIRTNAWMKRMYAHAAPLDGKKCYVAYQDRKEMCPWCPTVKAMETGETQHAEVPYPNAEAVEGWINLSAFPLSNDHGEVTGAIEYVKDITERKLAEEEARKLAAVIKNSNELIVLAAMDGKMTFLNEAGGRVLGIDPQEVEHVNIIDVVPEHCVELVEGDLLPALARGGIWEGDLQYRNLKTGNLTDMHAMTFTVKDPDTKEPQFLANVSMDITERKRAEEEARRLAAVVKNSSELVNLATMDGKMIFLNEAGGRILGIDPQEVEHVNIMDVIPEDWMELVEGDLLPALARGGIWEGDLQYRNLKTGSLTDMHATTFTVKDPDTKEPQFLANVSMDITERKRAEEELRQSEERFATAFRSAPNAMSISALADGRFREVNEGFHRTIGYTREEAIGRTTHELNLYDDPASRDAVRETFEQGGRIDRREMRFRNKAGELIICEMSAETVEIGGEIYLLTAVNDITERRRAEEELRQAKEIAQEYLNIAGVILVALNDRGTTTLINRKGCQVLGCSEHEILGHNWFDRFILQDTREAARATFAQLTDGDITPVEYFENTVVTKRGERKLVAWHNTVLRDEAGNVTGTLSSGEDITARRRIEEELAKHRENLEELVVERTRELEESREKLRHAERLASIGTLAGGLAHEINNPVGGMLLAAQNALELVDRPGSTGLVETCLRDIVTSADGCSRIIQNVLQFARHRETKRCPSDLDAVIQRAVQSTAAHVQEHRGVVEFAPADDLPLVLLSPVEIEQVVANLIRNAAEAGVGAVRIRIRTEKGPDNVKIAVEDNGRGISPGQLKHVFDPFFTTRREHGGTGLGLGIAHGIIISHEGSISVESQPGHGTTFVVELPCKPAAPGGRKNVEGPDRR